ncbi:unnamed protein product [Symbiodinium sp. CCMP2592]|nr:unnamed protein product [Symbiodinium sp. CCMP2592]
MDEAAMRASAALQRTHGRDILAASYTKMMRLMFVMQSLCKKLGSEPSGQAGMLISTVASRSVLPLNGLRLACSLEVLAWVFLYTKVSLSRKWISQSALSADAFGDSRSNSTFTWAQAAIVKYHVLQQVAFVVDNITKDEDLRAELRGILETCLDVESFDKKFLPPEPKSTKESNVEVVVADAENQNQNDQEAKPVENAEGQPAEFDLAMHYKTPCGKALLEWMLGMLCGDVEKDFQSMFAGASDLSKALKEVLAVAVESTKSCGAWVKLVRGFMHELEVRHDEAAVEVAVGSAPKPMLRQLVRMSSDEDPAERLGKAQAERDALWTSCTTHRAKYLRILSGKGKSASELQEMIQTTSPFKLFQPAAGSHVAVLWAADLSGEAKDPWTNLYGKASTSLSQDETQRLELLQLLRHKDHFVVIAFDGRSKSWRLHLDSVIQGTELWLTYIGRPNEGCIPSRQVVFGSANKEVAMVYTSFSRSTVAVKNHEQIEDLLEGSNFYATMSGLKFPQCLPKMTATTKSGILESSSSSSSQSPCPPKWPSGRGVPLFWQESKSKLVYATLFSQLGVKMVVDLEVGSGAAATAALDAGIFYTGIAKNDAHAGWVTNILDRYALSLMVKKGHRLYNETLKDAVRELFGNEIDKELSESPVELEGEKWSDTAIPDAE